MLNKSEATRPGRLRESQESLQAMLRDDDRTRADNMAEYRRSWQAEQLRWIERQPAYRQVARDLWDGDPERARRQRG